MPPRPPARALGCFGHVAVFVVCGVNQSNVAVVGFGRFVQKREHPAHARHGLSYAAHRLRHLHYVVCKRAAHCQKRHYHAGRKRVPTRKTQIIQICEYHCAARKREEHVQKIAYVAHNRTEHVGVAVGFFHVAVQFVVYFVEILFYGVFVAEHFNHLLPVHHLLDVALEPAERLLLFHEISRSAAAHYFGYEHHYNRGYEHYAREPHAVIKHNSEISEYHYRRANYAGNALRCKLHYGVYVVGVRAHYVAVGVSVEIFYGERLHFVEHIHPYLL